jgi:calmodulin
MSKYSHWTLMLLILLRIDSSGDGQIDFEEFVEVMSRKVNATYSAEQVKGAFRVFEGNSPAGCVRSDALIRFE